MSSTGKRDIYLGTSLGQLNKLAEVDRIIGNARVYLKSADKVFASASECDMAGDEEKAYVLYMKYFNIIRSVKASADYKKQTRYYNGMITTRTCTTAISRAEKLADSLKQRYETIKIVPVLIQPSSVMDTEIVETKENGTSVAVRQDTGIQFNDVVDSDVPKGAVSAKTVYSLLCRGRETESSILLIDLRRTDEFMDSHISHESCINIPADIVRPGTMIKHFETRIPDASRPGWNRRKAVSLVVLFDWSSTIDDVKRGTVICSLKDALYKWETKETLKNEPLVLEGGYEAWLFYYPTVTTNAKPTVRPSTVLNNESQRPSLNFEYPLFDHFSVSHDASRSVSGYSSLTEVSDANVIPRRPLTAEIEYRPTVPRTTALEESNLDKFIGRRPTVDRSLKPKDQHAVSRQSNVQEFDAGREGEPPSEKAFTSTEDVSTDTLHKLKDYREDDAGQKAVTKPVESVVDSGIADTKDTIKTSAVLHTTETSETGKDDVEPDTASKDGKRDAPVRHNELERPEMTSRNERLPVPRVAKPQKPNAGPQRSTTSRHAVPNDTDSVKSALRRSSSTPNIARQNSPEHKGAVEPQLEQPVVDRATKPARFEANRQTISDFQAGRLITMQPQYGSVEGGLTGLRNLGNTCYMNSILQCLNNTPPLVTYFLTENYKRHINRNNFLGHGGDIPDELAIVVRALWSAKYTTFSPIDFKRVVGKHNPQFAGYEQQDSQEFLMFLLDGLHEDLNMVKERPKIAQQENDDIPVQKAAELAWYNHKLLNESIIVELFQGQYKSMLTCLSCDKHSVTFDTFMCLSLPVPSSTRCTLQDCLQHFLREEKMTGGSKWFCPRCKCRREARKKIDLWKLPVILLIHLKRFSSSGDFGQKLNTFVNFPLSRLDMSQYVKGKRMKPLYNLYAASNHYGTIHGGHYTAYCRNTVLKRWYRFDDSDVHTISENDVKSSAAYTLFYTSIEMTPPVM